MVAMTEALETYPVEWNGCTRKLSSGMQWLL